MDLSTNYFAHFSGCRASFVCSCHYPRMLCHVFWSQVEYKIVCFIYVDDLVWVSAPHPTQPPPPPISSDIEIGIRCQYASILKFMLYRITYLRKKYSKSVFSTSLGVGMWIRNLYRIACTHNKSQPTKSSVWQNIDVCVNDCNVAAIDFPLEEACDFGALHYMLPALMLGCEPPRRRVDIDGKHPLQSDISI